MQRKEFWMTLALSGLIAGCGGSTTTVTSRDGGTQVTVASGDGGTVRVSNDENGLSIPEDFPKDVPVPSGCVVTTSATVQNTVTLVLKSPEPLKKVAAFYKEQLKTQEWNVDATVDTPDGTVLTASKGNRSLTATVGKEDNGAVISLAIETKP